MILIVLKSHFGTSNYLLKTSVHLYCFAPSILCRLVDSSSFHSQICWVVCAISSSHNEIISWSKPIVLIPALSTTLSHKWDKLLPLSPPNNLFTHSLHLLSHLLPFLASSSTHMKPLYKILNSGPYLSGPAWEIYRKQQASLDHIE